MEVTRHEPGMFSWADLASPYAAGSKKFYTELLEVDATDMAAGPDAFYTTLNKNGRNTCAIYQMDEEMKQMLRGQALWHSYFTVESADDAARRVSELGGAVVAEPFDVFEAGRTAVVRDSTGAAFSVWQPKSEIGAQIFGEPGALAWNELYTHDTDAAEKFYAGLFGWSANRRMSADSGDYVEYRLGGKPAAGMMAIRKEWGEVPPYWSIYLAVADLTAARAKAKELGAREITPLLEVPEVGRFVFIQDPQGAYVTIIQITRGAA